MVAAAIVGSAVVGAAGAAAAGNANAKAAKKASDAQVTATREANDTQERIYQDQKKTLTPTALAGAQARARQMRMQGFSEDEVNTFLRDQYGAYGQTDAPTLDGWNWEMDPGYQFRMDEGRKSIERSAAARGDLFSGSTGRALTEYGQDYGSQEFQRVFDRFGQLAGEGDQNQDTIVNVTGSYGNNVSNNLLRIGDARASGYRARGDARANEYMGYADAIGGAIGAFGGGGYFK